MQHNNATKVFYKFNAPEKELEFVKWTAKFLIVKYPADSLSAGKPWRLGLGTVSQLISNGVLRIEGEIPEIE